MPSRLLRSIVLAAATLSLYLVLEFPARALERFETQSATGGSVTGVVLSASDSPQSKTQVRLVKVRLVSLVGEEIRALPLKGTAIIDSDGKAVAVAETDSSGRFEFKNVLAGRYSLAVPSKLGGSAAGQLWLESRGRTVFFDIAGNQGVELGTVKAEKQK
jgi:hypothetical protein